MNYKQSKQILKEIKKAKRILLNCHRGPDPDSIGSALAMYWILKKMGKSVDIVCPSEQLYESVSFLKGYGRIQKEIDFSEFDFSEYDLFITLDSSDWQQVTADKNIPLPKIPLVVIDHHVTNPGYGSINLIDHKTTSVGEILYRTFHDWNFKPDKNIANCLMTAIIGDTGAFRFPGVTPKTFQTAQLLMEAGANKDKIIHHIYRSEDFKLMKFYGEALAKSKIDKKARFFWSAISLEDYKRLGNPSFAKEATATLFAQVVEDTDFGFIAVEREKGKLNVSLRSRTGLDVSKIALELGGGGHQYAAGGGIEDLPFDEAVEKVLQICRKHAKKYKEKSK
ncbi:bifunctional oligoribonuclease/PAP phosphatase NrnA [Patescibacteria group bacterium]|nr:bifunctional oligoribonuclease/PAP phosphatase NrnA [Patescibacteria group bacterium]